jgi:hypothetical protein
MVSSLGRVKSLPRNTTRGGLLSIKIGKRGYPAVGLVQDGKQATYEVHRLVALAFLGECAAGYEVRHRDGNPLNNHVLNLVYGTRGENVRDRRSHGTDHNVNKTHCPQGHPYFGDNLLTIPSRPSARYCRACHNARSSRKNRAA